MIQVLAIRKTRYLQWQLPKVFADDEVDLPAQFRAMFYEQCFGRGSMSEQVRENFNYIFSDSNEAYMCPLHEGTPPCLHFKSLPMKLIDRLHRRSQEHRQRLGPWNLCSF